MTCDVTAEIARREEDENCSLETKFVTAECCELVILDKKLNYINVFQLNNLREP